MQFVSFVGFAGSGKSTCGEYLARQHGFKQIAFADALKDACAAMFCWPRHLLEGDTAESRTFRETVDQWWAERLDIAGFTPRWALRNIGTEVMRAHFHSDLWLLNVERRIADLPARCPGVVFTDARFPNEFALVRGFGSKIIRVRRGPEPAWMAEAERASRGDIEAGSAMQHRHGVHESEWRWTGLPIDGLIENDAGLSTLYQRAEGWIAQTESVV